MPVTVKKIRRLDSSAHVADLNDQIEKLAIFANGLEKKIGATPASVANVAVPVVQSGSTTIKENPFKQIWRTLYSYVNPDVRDVTIGNNLTLTPNGQFGVRLDNPQSSTRYLPCSFGGWTSLNEIMPIPLWAGSLTKLRVEARFIYLNATAGTFFRVSPNHSNTLGSDFVIFANYDGTTTDTTKWCLSMKNVNVVTFPAPPAKTVCTLIVEFDGTNAGVGKAQWLVGVDTGSGITLQTCTNVAAANVGTIPQAFRLTWGSNYGDPTFATSSSGSAPANLFDGGIAERRVFTGVTGSFTTEPAYTTLVGDWRVQNLVQATYTDTGIITMHQSSSGQPLSGSANIYICTGNSVPIIYPSVAPNLGGLVPITIPIGGLAHGFPGTLSIQTTPISMSIPTYNVNYAVITPNVARIKNLAYPNEDRYDLFNIPVANSNPLVYPATQTTQAGTLKGLVTPEQFIGANQ